MFCSPPERVVTAISSSCIPKSKQSCLWSQGRGFPLHHVPVQPLKQLPSSSLFRQFPACRLCLNCNPPWLHPAWCSPLSHTPSLTAGRSHDSFMASMGRVSLSRGWSSGRAPISSRVMKELGNPEWQTLGIAHWAGVHTPEPGEMHNQLPFVLHWVSDDWQQSASREQLLNAHQAWRWQAGSLAYAEQEQCPGTHALQVLFR
jgi:hypothetical protein